MNNRQESAHALALQALGWLAEDGDRLGGFLAVSGLDPAELRARADDPMLLAAVLDHMLGDESQLLAFCVAVGVAPDAPSQARAYLPGGDAPFWT